jgi:hypothetical protein
MIEFDAKKSLFKPIEVKLGGKVFTLRKVDREVIRKLGEYERLALKGNPDAAYQELEFLLGKDPLLDRLDIREVGNILIEIAKLVFKGEQFESDEVKNESRPGAKK